MKPPTDKQMKAVAKILRIVVKFELQEAIEVTAIVAGITWDKDRWSELKRVLT